MSLFNIFGKNGVASAAAKKKTPPRDSIREMLETIVFVVVLVFLLKQFVVEAFVIPTGSMAETLFGYQKTITCAECNFQFALNSSREVEQGQMVQGYCCPNCRYKHVFPRQEARIYNGSGDRVLVHKAIYHKFPAERGDVVVFKFPQEPQRLLGAQNYIKRLWGLGGETIAIHRGDLYVCTSIAYPPLDHNPPPEDLWHMENCYPGETHERENEATKRFRQSQVANFADVGGFRLVRKSDVHLDAMKRIVWDNEYQSTFLTNRGVPPRWKPLTDDWTSDNPSQPKTFTHQGGSLGWIRYQHLLVDDFTTVDPTTKKPTAIAGPIDNFLGYNGEVYESRGERFFAVDQMGDSRFWVGDLIVETQVKFSDPAAVVVLELSKGANQFQAKFHDGNVTLIRTGPGGKELVTKPTGINGGTHTLRFANVDCSLRVWVDGRKIDIGSAGEYDPITPEKFDPRDDKHEGWTTKNDIDGPVRMGASGSVEFGKLKIWRDTYFINRSYPRSGDVCNYAQTYYVQPGHYLCLGDNSAQSSDGRYWGAVPERLMLGKASFVFFPLDRIGFIK